MSPAPGATRRREEGRESFSSTTAFRQLFARLQNKPPTPSAKPLPRLGYGGSPCTRPPATFCASQIGRPRGVPRPFPSPP